MVNLPWCTTLTYKIIPTPEVNPPIRYREECEQQKASNGGDVTQENSLVPAQLVAKVNLSAVHGGHLELIGERLHCTHVAHRFLGNVVGFC